MADNNNTLHLSEFYRNVLNKSPLLYGHQYIVTFTGDLPDPIKSDPNSLQSITYYVKATKVPSIDMGEQQIAFLSQQFVVPKNILYPDEWTVDVLLTNNMLHYDSLYEWQNWYANLRNDGGSQDGHSKAIPNTIAHVKLLDSTMQSELHEFNLVGVFPTKIPDLSMKYENNATPVNFPCTFCFQYMYRTEEGDPLQA